MFSSKSAFKDQWEAGDHRTDCVRHIVSLCRHIVFNLAYYCQLGEEVGERGSKNMSRSVSNQCCKR